MLNSSACLVSSPSLLCLREGDKVRRLFVTCDVFARYFFGPFPGFFVTLVCLEKQCSWLFRGFFVVLSWLFRGFFVALILGELCTYYSPWKSPLTRGAPNPIASQVGILWICPSVSWIYHRNGNCYLINSENNFSGPAT